MARDEIIERYFAMTSSQSPGSPSLEGIEMPVATYGYPTNNLDEEMEAVEPEVDIEFAMKFEYQSLIESQAFQWLLTRLQRELRLTNPTPNNMSIIQDRILQDIPNSRKVSRSQPVDACMAIFAVDWDPRAFLEEQKYSEPPDEAIEKAITITGYPSCAQAVTAQEYLRQTWPNTGIWTLNILKDLVLNESGHFDAYNVKVTALMHEGQLIVTVHGPVEFIIEVGQQLSWLGSALRSSHVTDGLAYCTPSFENADSDYSTKLAQTHGNRTLSYKVSFAWHQREYHEPLEGTCWHALFRNPVIVEGFPIRCRAENNNGLDIPLDIMAGLIRTRQATEFDDRIFIKGFSALLFPTKFMGDTIIWHYIYNPDGSHISYLDPRTEGLQDTGAKEISLNNMMAAGMHILGWCSTAKCYAGLCAKYPIRRSRCDETHSHWIFEKFNITAGQYITLNASFSLGEKDKPLILWSSSSYDQQVLHISKKFVLLYDVEERRAWLVNGATALLQLVIASLKYEKSSPIGYKFLSELECLRNVGPQYRADSALRTLVEEDNMSLPILPGRKQQSPIYFSEKVEQVMDYLQKAFIYQEDKANRSGHQMRFTQRNLLEGFDFTEIAESQSSVPRRVVELKATGKYWIDFVRKIKAVSLFGRGFGDLISPIRAPCDRWGKMPTGEDYLAVCVQDLNSIIDMHGNRGERNVEIVKGIFWHMPDKLFGHCTCQSNISAACERVQVLLPDRFNLRRFTKHILPPESLHGNEEGAVIFGRSGKLPVYWPDDLSEMDQEGQLMSDYCNTPLVHWGERLGSGSTTTNTDEGSARTVSRSEGTDNYPETASSVSFSYKGTSQATTF
ncbi:hypothetical protein BDV26DRAFT_255120 [Aspergillus bertholletiae]|uniref:Pfs domain protein n=1 Tax=Aspergillus bertholletiae TaxID=1226010 RepID=A0A5N7BJ48_9EURO|nr:hypothetical protein BDV26DRAFT_255120 [Aspergillus bertholletiae]